MKLFFLLAVLAFGCSREEASKNDQPLPASEIEASQQNQDELYDPMTDPERMLPPGQTFPLPEGERQYPGEYAPYTPPYNNDGSYGYPSPQYPGSGTLPAPGIPGESYGPSQGLTGPLPLFVVMGGYASCRHQFGVASNKQNLFTSFLAFRQELAGLWHYEAPYVMTCFEKGNPIIRFVTSARPGEVGEIDESEIVQVIQSMAGPGTPLSFIGHSYGGWLVMKTASAMIQTQRVASIMTLDPISANSCKRPFLPGCRRAPQDFGAEQLEALAQLSGYWLNVFQRRTPYIMSSEIPYATQNARISARHYNIDSHPATWDLIRNYFFSIAMRNP